MDGGGVDTDSTPSDSSSDLPKTPGGWFEYLCPFYMSYGMTYDEYWDGDNTRPRYYRKKHKLEQQAANFAAWLQGAYVYEAMLNCAPTLNALSKSKDPVPYRDAPIPLTHAEAQRELERRQEKQMREARDAMQLMVDDFNRQFNKGKGDSKDGSGT